MKNDIIDLLIIGSGPAGYTAAIYASRAGLNPILYQGKEPGGQLTITSDVENYPGYPNGIQGPEMMLDFQKQAERFGTIVKGGFIKSVDFSKYPFEIIDDNDKILIVNSVIISTGASAKWLGLESEKKFNGNGVSACAVCDGFFFKDQIVAVVGGGDTAAEESLYLSKITKKVFLIVRRNELRASKIMQKRVFENENIEIIWNSEVKDVLGDDKVDSVLVLNNSNNTTSKLNISGLFIAIGHKPNTDIFKNYIDLDDNGYILTKPGTTQTNIKGVFATGDAQDKIYRQAVTAAGSGCMGALEAEKFLSENNLS
jgi:thioredoxin reductase (NADPH)